MESPPQNRTLVRMLIRVSAGVLRTLGLTGCKLLGSGRSYLGGIGCMLTNSNCLCGLIMMVDGWCSQSFLRTHIGPAYQRNCGFLSWRALMSMIALQHRVYSRSRLQS